MKNSSNPIWPNDADGEVLRGMQSSEFDFATATDIDFNIDFETWPPPEEFMNILHAQYSLVYVIPPDAHGKGYVQFVVHPLLTYELVMFLQRSVSELAAPFGGVCESWGVMQ